MIMTTRACDFSSFKRPPKSPAILNSSPNSTSYNGSRSINGNETYSTTPRYTNQHPWKYTRSESTDPNSNRSNDSMVDSFRNVTSPSLSSFSPAPVTTFSTQNLDNFNGYDQRTPSISHATIDRTTLPYDHKHSISRSTPINERTPSGGIESKKPGSGLILVDRGKRGVMPADSQQSLTSLNGHPLDRSLVPRQKSYRGQNSYDRGYDGGYGTHPGIPQYASECIIPSEDVMHQPGYTSPYHPTDNVYSPGVGPNNTFTMPYKNIGDGSCVMYNTTGARHDDMIRPQRSHHNVSTGESSIAGCDINTLGTRSHNPVSESTSNYTTGLPANNNRYASMRNSDQGSNVPLSRAEAQDRQMKSAPGYPSGTQLSNCESHRSTNTTESSLTHRADANYQTQSNRLLAGSENPLNMSMDDNSISILEQAPSRLNFNSSYPKEHSSVPKISTRSSSRGSYKKGFSLFKSKKKSRSKTTTDIYSRNNLYGSSNDKSSNKYNSKVILGMDGGTNTGIQFSTYSPMKRNFCPKWQCVLLTVGVGIALFLIMGLITYLYVWPAILEPLVESSKPVDGQWGSWRPWFECTATCGAGTQNRTRECNQPSPEDGGKDCQGKRYEMRRCHAPIECPDCSRVCDVGTLSGDCRSCTCEGHVVTGKITDEYGSPLPGVKIYKESGAALLLGGTDTNGEFRFEGVCSNGDNELRLEKDLYRTSIVRPTQSKTDQREGFVAFAMIKLFLPTFTSSPSSEQRLAAQTVVMCCEAEGEQPPTEYIWFKDHSRLDPTVYKYSLESPSLSLSDLMEWDSGEYTCEVHNEAGSVTSEPALLTVYGNWTDLCDPVPADKLIDLPDGCSQKTFNTGTCEGKSGGMEMVSNSEYPQCISPGQYSEDSLENVCYDDSTNRPQTSKFCCKPLEEEEINVSCTFKDGGTHYNMALKRVLSCGCEIC